MTNILFCYWLQGYFEISNTVILEKFHILKIEENLAKITEPLRTELKWLEDVCHYFKSMDYKKETLNYFMPYMQQMLNSVFYHFIDNDKDIEYSIEELEKLHEGNNI